MRTANQIAAFKRLSANQRRILTSHRRDRLETDERDARCTLRDLEMRFGKLKHDASLAEQSDGEYDGAFDHREESPMSLKEIGAVIGCGPQRTRQILEGALHKIRRLIMRNSDDYDTRSPRYELAVILASTTREGRGK